MHVRHSAKKGIVGYPFEERTYKQSNSISSEHDQDHNGSRLH